MNAQSHSALDNLRSVLLGRVGMHNYCAAAAVAHTNPLQTLSDKTR